MVCIYKKTWDIFREYFAETTGNTIVGVQQAVFNKQNPRIFVYTVIKRTGVYLVMNYALL